MDLGIRNQFPILETKNHGFPLIYLDSAATMQKPLSVIQTISDFYQKYYGTVHRAVYSLAEKSTENYQNVRKKAASFIGALEDEIVFTKGTTDALNLLAFSLGEYLLKPGDEILISEIEHHSNIVPWQMAAKRHGAHLKTIPVTDAGDIDLDALINLLGKQTKIVSLAHISNTVGTIHPIEKINKIIKKESEALFVIDGAQGIAHLPVNIKKIGCDFYAFSGHKLYGPTGIGVLFGKKQLLDAMPPYQGGGDMIETVTFHKTTYQKGPLKFEAGTPPIAEVIGLGAAIDFVKSIGMENIFSHEKLLTKMALQELLEIPSVKVLGSPKERSGIISFNIEGAHPLDLAMLLDLKGVSIRTGHLCSQPTMRRFGYNAVARASFAGYTTHEEIHLFIHYLKEALKTITK